MLTVVVVVVILDGLLVAAPLGVVVLVVKGHHVLHVAAQAQLGHLPQDLEVAHHAQPQVADEGWNLKIYIFRETA